MVSSRKTKKDRSISVNRPGAGVGDAVHTLARVGLSAIPVVGGPLAELFSGIIGPPLVKRFGRWVESLAIRLKELEMTVNGFKFDDLSKNETFITTIVHATQVAIRNHQEEKLEALRNAVLNSALPSAPEEDLQLMFLSFVDDLTPRHLRVLRFFENPKEEVRRTGITANWTSIRPSAILEFVFSEFKAQRGLYELIIRDLSAKGLIRSESLNTLMNAERALSPWTTGIGEQFIRFITSPS